MSQNWVSESSKDQDGNDFRDRIHTLEDAFLELGEAKRENQLLAEVLEKKKEEVVKYSIL